MTDEIRQIIDEHGRLPSDVSTLAPDADLYQAGLSSHASVNMMLALEDRFDIEFPDRMLTPSVFESIASIEVAVSELSAERGAVMSVALERTSIATRRCWTLSAGSPTTSRRRTLTMSTARRGFQRRRSTRCASSGRCPRSCRPSSVVVA